MKKYFISLTILAMSINLYATNMQDLFDALKQNPTVKLDEISVNKSKIDEQKVYAKLYPKITLFTKYDNYSTPTATVPIPPNEMIKMVQNQNIGQPFGYNIYRIGGSFSMPIFVKSIYTFGDMAKLMAESSKAKKEINLLQNEAILVASNANLLYLQSLTSSLNSKATSLNESKKFVKINVDSGRMAESQLYKIEDAVVQVDIALNNVNIEEQNLYAQILTLTNIKISEPIQMETATQIQEGEYRSLEPLRKKSLALKYGLKAQKENRWYPTISANGSYTRNYTKAYNNDADVYENYGQIGVVLAFELFDAQSDTTVLEARVDAMRAQTQLEKEQLAVDANAKALLKSIELLKRSNELYEKSVENKLRLRDIAKVSFKNGRMNMLDYLEYEDDYVAQEAKLFQARAKLWQLKMKLAVIYGNNIEEMVK